MKRALTVLLLLALPACARVSGGGLPPTTALGGAETASNAVQKLYTMNTTIDQTGSDISVFNPKLSPAKVAEISGPATKLSSPRASGIGVDAAGRIYGGIDGKASTVQVFGASANQNAKPLFTIVLGGLKGPALGFALGTKTLWTIDAPKGGQGMLAEFPLTKGLHKPLLIVSPQVITAGGLVNATAAHLATDSAGNVYCACSTTGTPKHGGVSVYGVDATGHATFKRSFYDPSMPKGFTELGVSPAGVVYAAATGKGGVIEIREYSAKAHSAGVKPVHVISGSRTRLQNVGGMAIDAAGNLWVADAVAGNLVEFAAGAHGNVAPKYSLSVGGYGATPSTWGNNLVVH